MGSHLRDIYSIIYQIFNIKKIIKIEKEIDLEKEYTICCLIPVYAEYVELVINNIASLSKQKLPKNVKILIFIVCDGLVVGKENKRPLFNELDDIIDYKIDSIYEESYICWKTLKENKIICKFGEYNNVPIILSHKEKNCGKKDSLIIAETVLDNFNNFNEFKNLYNLGDIDFIYHTDSDTIADENCLHYLLKKMEADESLTGVSGMVRAYYNNDFTGATKLQSLIEKSLFRMQDFQYFFSLIVRRNAESVLKATSCLPGCVNMIRMSSIAEEAIQKYGDLPEKETNLFQAITRMQGTDRRYTSLLLVNEAKLQMEWRAIIYTEPPLTFKSFINQRRRWSSNAFFNSLLLIFSKNISLYVRISCFIDVSRLFATIFRLVSYIAFWVLIMKMSITNLIILGIVLLFPYIYITIWLYKTVDEWKELLIGLLLNKIIMPLLSSYTISKMFFTATNFAWGGFVAKPEEKKDEQLEISIEK